MPRDELFVVSKIWVSNFDSNQLMDICAFAEGWIDNAADFWKRQLE